MTRPDFPAPESKETCGAKTRRGTPCPSAAMKNGRCRMHGGKSTGPRTSEGLERSRKARWKHGLYSKEFLEQRKAHMRAMREIRKFLRERGGENHSAPAAPPPAHLDSDRRMYDARS
jgi:hypothetical protein